MQEINDNYHLIAISNLTDPEYQLKRWWCNKYQIPLKSLDEYTIEELFIEMLEDYYADNPKEIEKFKNKEEEEWDGTMSIEYENSIRPWLEKQKDKNLLAKYDSDIELTEEEEKEMLKNLGKNLIPRDEFEESF